MNKGPRYPRHRFPIDIISQCVWLYYRFCLSHRDVEEMMAERGVTVSYETVRIWCGKFGGEYARRPRARHGMAGDSWHLDEVYLRISGQLQYLWRAVDQDGEVLDVLVQPRRNQAAAIKFFRRLLMSQGRVPRQIVTDKLGSYAAAKVEVMPSVSLFQRHRSPAARSSAGGRREETGGEHFVVGYGAAPGKTD